MQTTSTSPRTAACTSRPRWTSRCTGWFWLV
jgi:hypothetical protein